jgi:hypothetical protein
MYAVERSRVVTVELPAGNGASGREEREKAHPVLRFGQALESGYKSSKRACPEVGVGGRVVQVPKLVTRLIQYLNQRSFGHRFVRLRYWRLAVGARRARSAG